MGTAMNNITCLRERQLSNRKSAHVGHQAQHCQGKVFPAMNLGLGILASWGIIS